MLTSLLERELGAEVDHLRTFIDLLEDDCNLRKQEYELAFDILFKTGN
ncbi:MAG: hypothetical protein JSS09_02635 [Verrucomicrobia bacterium]|nr:hypothetical protein [Verrucomicrobiota bacterium]